jgi:tRNA nucleotidyltransferase (CCA-adding enzyme)
MGCVGPISAGSDGAPVVAGLAKTLRGRPAPTQVEWPHRPVHIIITHDNPGFDALASAIAATHLYPRARVVLGDVADPGVRNYLAIHKDRFPTMRPDQFDHERVTRMIVVGTRDADQLPDYRRLIERARNHEMGVHVFDHHPAGRDDLVGEREHIEPVGSTTTLLVERLAERELEVDAEEATLLAIAIRAQTGTLSRVGTTAQDAEAYGWTLRQGAKLAVIGRYLEAGFGATQYEVLGRTLGTLERVRVGGVNIGTAIVALDEGIADLEAIVAEVSSLERCAAILAVFVVANQRAIVIGHTTARGIHLGEALAAVGGTGGATQVQVAHADGDAIIENMLRALRSKPPRGLRVSDVMSSPVRCVSPETSLNDAQRQMQAARVRGLVVALDGKAVGVVSKRDLEAAGAGRMHLAVSTCMSLVVHATNPAASLEDALAQMAEADVGRLPVTLAGRLIGIVTRADVLAVLYSGDD